MSPILPNLRFVPMPDSRRTYTIYDPWAISIRCLGWVDIGLEGLWVVTPNIVATN